MLLGSVLNDRRLLDQYGVVPDQTQPSEVKYDVVGQMGSSCLLAAGPC